MRPANVLVEILEGGAYLLTEFAGKSQVVEHCTMFFVAMFDTLFERLEDGIAQLTDELSVQ